MLYYLGFYSLQSLLLSLGSIRGAAVLAFIVAAVFSGIRYQVGYDFDVYLDMYADIETYRGFVEPGFVLMVEILGRLGIGERGMVFVFSLLTQAAAFAALRAFSGRLVGFAYFLYLIVPGLYLNSFSIVRQALAIALIGMAVSRLFVDKSRSSFAVFGACAASIHVSAVLPLAVAALVAWATRRAPTGPLRLGWLAGAWIASLVAQSVGAHVVLLGPFEDFRFFLYGEAGDETSPLKVLGINATFLAVTLVRGRWQHQPLARQLFFVWFAGLCMFNLFVASQPLTRIYYYFAFCSLPLIAYATARATSGVRGLERLGWVFFFGATLVLAFVADAAIDQRPNMLDYAFVPG